MDTISKHQGSSIAPVRSGSGVRRYYRREQKRRIVEETFAPGASVSVVARKHDVNANIVCKRHPTAAYLSVKHVLQDSRPIA